MKIQTKVGCVSGQRKVSQALVICVSEDGVPMDGDGVEAHALADQAMKTSCSGSMPLGLGAPVSTPALNLHSTAVFHVRAPYGVSSSEDAVHLQQTMLSILRLARESEIQSLAMPAIGAGRNRSGNAVAADIIVRALLRDAPRLARALKHVTICLPSTVLTKVFAKAQQINDPSDLRPKTVDAAVKHLVATLPWRFLDELSSLREDELIHTHFAMGLRLRNELLRGNYALLDDTGQRHPDGASSVLVRAVWSELRLNGKNATHLA